MKVAGLRYAYHRGGEVLRGVDLEIAPGEFVGMIGSNGSGKSTLAFCIKGLLQPSGGVISFEFGN